MSDPVFVYGGLRSGTTVFRLMLNAHPELSNPGEVDHLFDHLHRAPGGGWRYDLDALSLDRRTATVGPALREVSGDPASRDGRALLAEFVEKLAARGTGLMSLNIHRNLGKIAALFPGARFIHLLRDPRDVARSCIGMGWAGTTWHGVRSWIDTERAWDDVAPRLAPGDVLELRYEDLVADPPRRLREVCEFMGVAFDPAMLRYHENTTYEPPDPARVQQWRRTLGEDELAMLEWKLGELLTARGYAPSGVVPRPPAPHERIGLAVRNKMAVWRFAIRRYGAALVLTEKISRRLGLRSLHRRAKNEIGARTTSYLK
jgi:hypothetical protein